MRAGGDFSRRTGNRSKKKNVKTRRPVIGVAHKVYSQDGNACDTWFEIKERRTGLPSLTILLTER